MVSIKLVEYNIYYIYNIYWLYSIQNRLQTLSSTIFKQSAVFLTSFLHNWIVRVLRVPLRRARSTRLVRAAPIRFSIWSYQSDDNVKYFHCDISLERADGSTGNVLGPITNSDRRVYQYQENCGNMNPSGVASSLPLSVCRDIWTWQWVIRKENKNKNTNTNKGYDYFGHCEGFSMFCFVHSVDQQHWLTFLEFSGKHTQRKQQQRRPSNENRPCPRLPVFHPALSPGPPPPA